MSKNTVLNLAEAMLEAEAFEIIFSGLEKVRKEKPEQFINLIISYSNKANNIEVNYLFHRLKLTDEEIISLIQIGWIVSNPREKIEALLIFQKTWLHLVETEQIGTIELHQLGFIERQKILEQLKFTESELDTIRRFVDKSPIGDDPQLPTIQWKFLGWKTAGLLSVKPEISGDELLKTALQKIIDEKKFKKPSDYLSFVNRRVIKAYPKNNKPYTNEQLTTGVEWYIATRKKITGKKAENDQRSRSRVNIPKKEWNAFMLEHFGSRSPDFANEYQKNVRDEVRKITKRQMARSLSK